MGDPPKQIKSTSGLRSFTLKQIANAKKPYKEAAWEVDGQEVAGYQQVTVVAHLIREEPRDGKKVSYYLDDGTAFLRAWRTLPGEGESYDPKDHLLAVPDEACYVRIIGTLTRIKDNPVPSINVHGIRRVTDGNEIIHHYMESMLGKMAIQRGWPSEGQVQRARTLGDEEYAVNTPREETVPSGSQYTASQYPATQYSASQVAAFYQPTPPTTPHRTALASPRSTLSPSPARSLPPGRSPSQSLDQARTLPSVGEGSSSGRHIYQTPTRSTPSTQPASPAPVTPTRMPGSLMEYETPPAQVQGSSGLQRDPLAHLTGLQRQVMLNIMNSREGNSPRGAHVRAVTRAIRMSEPNPNSVSPVDIVTAIDELTDRQLIESTDEEFLYYRVVDRGRGYDLPTDT